MAKKPTKPVGSISSASAAVEEVANRINAIITKAEAQGYILVEITPGAKIEVKIYLPE